MTLPVLSMKMQMISIHSLRVEGDIYQNLHPKNKVISIHSLRVEGDHNHSTKSGTEQDFNPLPPCGGRPVKHDRVFCKIISIHSLRVEGDK